MLTELCEHLHNWFCVDTHAGHYAISEGSITLPFLVTGQHFRIVGSVLNDGVYRYPAHALTDETFDGVIWAMAVPPSVIALDADIDAWRKTHPESPYQSESFGGYSYSRATDAGGNPASWQAAFRARLNPWRKL